MRGTKWEQPQASDLSIRTNVISRLQSFQGAGIKALIGILPPDTDVDAARMEYLTQKYLSRESND